MKNNRDENDVIWIPTRISLKVRRYTGHVLVMYRGNELAYLK